MCHSPDISRRSFLREGACAALKTTGLFATLANLRLIAGAAATDSSLAATAGDYKALVCVFLYGGNDANNLLIPTDTSNFNLYTRSRAELALPRTSLVDLKLRDGRSFAVHPSAAPLGKLFDQGKLNFLSNVGTLVAPVTRRDYVEGTAALPYQLFSHADQAMQWQTSRPDNSLETSGWGGRVADLLQALNETSQISMCVSLAGTNTFQNGNATFQLQLDNDGPVSIDAIQAQWADPTRRKVLEGLLRMERKNLFEQQFASVNQRAMDNYTRISGALGQVPAPTGFPESDLASQLKLIARVIKAGPALGLRRQIFFASIGGWDNHDNQLTSHAENVAELSAALAAFQGTLDGYGMADAVTLFTASDFGRTLASNGKGSDHGWGSHHLIMGGAVNPHVIAGTFPSLVINGPNDTDQGRWIPTTSVDQYAAALARWFGVPTSSLTEILPNIGRFSRDDLGLFKAGVLAS